MSSPDSTLLASDAVFEILSSYRRRMVLYYLRQHGESATMDELAKQIAAWENDVPVEELTSQQRKRVYVSLYQTHLPKLAETALVDYDEEAGDVRLTDRATEMDAFLTSRQTESYPWRRHYLLLVVLGGALMVLGVLATPVLGPMLLVGFAVGLLLGYAATLTAQFWQARQESDETPVELHPHNQ